MLEKTLPVSAIKEGTVIDHITQGFALVILKFLKISEHRTTIGLNLASQSMGAKDLIKIENRFLTEKEAHDIAVFAPQATLSLIRDFHVEQKIKARLPEVVQNLLVCPNPCCITHQETTHTLFHVEEFKQKIFLRCSFCEKVFDRKEMRAYD